MVDHEYLDRARSLSSICRELNRNDW